MLLTLGSCPAAQNRWSDRFSPWSLAFATSAVRGEGSPGLWGLPPGAWKFFRFSALGRCPVVRGGGYTGRFLGFWGPSQSQEGTKVLLRCWGFFSQGKDGSLLPPGAGVPETKRDLPAAGVRLLPLSAPPLLPPLHVPLPVCSLFREGTLTGLYQSLGAVRGTERDHWPNFALPAYSPTPCPCALSARGVVLVYIGLWALSKELREITGAPVSPPSAICPLSSRRVKTPISSWVLSEAFIRIYSLNYSFT